MHALPSVMLSVYPSSEALCVSRSIWLVVWNAHVAPSTRRARAASSWHLWTACILFLRSSSETVAGAAPTGAAAAAADGWQVADRAAEVAPNMLLLPLRGPKSCVLMAEEEESAFSESPPDVDEYGVPTPNAASRGYQLDIALLPASATPPPASPGPPGATVVPPRALGANATCVAYAVRPGVVRVVRVLDHQALEAASVCRVRE